MLVFKVTPPGKVPDVFEKEVAPVAATVYETKVPAAFDPKDPADVVHAGASETVKTWAEPWTTWTALPSGFSKYNK